MNLPNRLTLFRIILIPFYVCFLLIDITSFDNIIATVIFLVASFTDMLDGMIARKRGLVTDFGKFADPLADKILTVSAFICFVWLRIMPAWICIIIIAREFAVSGFRLVVAGSGKVIAASPWGKVKTVFQMIYIIMATLNGAPLFNYLNFSGVFLNIFNIMTVIVMYIALALTVVSMIDYFIKNRDRFTTKQ